MKMKKRFKDSISILTIALILVMMFTGLIHVGIVHADSASFNCGLGNNYGDTAPDGRFEQGVGYAYFSHTAIQFDAWFRFPGVTIPQGATITSANLTFYWYPADDYGDVVTLRAFAEDSGAWPISRADYLSRSQTSAYLSCTPDFSIGYWGTLPDISSIIQEIVNRGGWNSGNAIVIATSGTTGGSDACATQYVDTHQPILKVTWSSVPPDTTPPTFVNYGCNETRITSYPWQISVNWSDDVALSTAAGSAVFGYNYSGSWVNTTTAFNTVGPELFDIVGATWDYALPAGTVIQWEEWGKDAAGNWNSTGYQYIVLTYFDSTPPTYSNIAYNSTVAGWDSRFSVKAQDNVELSGYIFGTNNTGSWINDTWIASLQDNIVDSDINQLNTVALTYSGLGTGGSGSEEIIETGMNYGYDFTLKQIDFLMRRTGNPQGFMNARLIISSIDVAHSTGISMASISAISGTWYSFKFNYFIASGTTFAIGIFAENSTVMDGSNRINVGIDTSPHDSQVMYVWQSAWISYPTDALDFKIYSYVQSISKTITLDSTPGDTIKFEWWFNDTTNNWNNTGIQSFITITYPSTFDFIGMSSNIMGSSSTFSCLIGDPGHLDAYIFGSNVTGVWVNETIVYPSGDPEWANYTQILPNTDYVAYEWYAKDPAQWWASGVQISLLADHTPPTWSSITVSTTANGTSCSIGITWADNWELDAYRFGSNETGSWVNSSWTAFIDFTSPHTVTEIITLSLHRGDIDRFEWWCEDGNGNFANTGIHTIIVTGPWIVEFIVKDPVSGSITPTGVHGYSDGTVVAMTETPTNASYVFNRWDVSNNHLHISGNNVTVNGDGTVEAVFNPITVPYNPTNIANGAYLAIEFAIGLIVSFIAILLFTRVEKLWIVAMLCLVAGFLLQVMAIENWVTIGVWVVENIIFLLLLSHRGVKTK